jgi:hypothetical protein
VTLGLRAAARRQKTHAERTRRAAFETQRALRISFRRFVTLLERCYGRMEGGRRVREMEEFVSVKLGEPGRLELDEVEDQPRLFGHGLPNLTAFASRLSATFSLVEREMRELPGRR